MPTTTYPTVIERYYKKFYDKRAERPDEDVCVLVHSNKVSIVTLTPTHKALQSGPIKSLRYLIEEDGKKVGDVHGKKKLQAIKTTPEKPLCEITAGDGTVYTINCAVRGKLCELNDRLIADLTLLDTMAETNGFLAIILHYFCEEKDVCSYLLTADQYLNGEVITNEKGKQSNAKGKVNDKSAEGDSAKNDESMDERGTEEGTTVEAMEEDSTVENVDKKRTRGGRQAKNTPAKKSKR